VKRLFRRLIRIGLYADTPDDLLDEIKAINSIKFQGVIIVWLTGLATMFVLPHHALFLSAVMVMHLLAATFVLYANHRKAYGPAKWLFVMDPAFLVLTLIAYFGDGTNFQYILLICFLMYIYLFRRRSAQSFNSLTLFFIVSVTGVSVVYFGNIAVVELEPFELEVFRVSAFAFSAVLSSMMGVVLQRSARRRMEKTRETLKVTERDATILQTISDNMDEAIFKSNIQQGLQFVNEAFVRMYGYDSKQEIMAIAPVNLYESKSERDALLARIEKHGRVTNMLLRYRRKDGSTFWGRLSCAKVEEEGGEKFLVGTIADVTYQQEQTDLLQESETQLREAQRLAKVGNWRAYPDRKIVDWSGECASIHGFLPTHFEDAFERWATQFKDIDLQGIDAGIDRAERMNLSFEFGSWYHCPDGEEKFLYYICQQRDDEGERAWYGTVQDRTQLKRQELELSATREFYQSVFDNIPVEAELIDEDGRYYYISKNAIGDDEARSFMIGKTNADYAEYRNLPSEFAVVRDDRIREALSGDLTIRWEEKMQTRDGRDTYHIRNLVPIRLREGQVEKKFLIGYSFDINDIKRAQFRLEDRNEDLNQLNKELDRFVYSISHDLRAPIASVLGLNSLAEEAEDHDELNNILVMQREALDRLDRYIRDVIDYSRNKRMEVRPEHVKLRPIVDECLNDLLYMANEDSINYFVDVEDDLTFFTDALRLRIVINNLLSNAINYADPKKEKSFVAVDMRVADGSLEVKVKDNGIGIKEEFKDQIWDIFFRGVSTIPGSGLGLYILKESVKNIKGQVDFESAEGEGTEFVVRLPELSTED